MAGVIEAEAGGVKFRVPTDLLYTDTDEWVKIDGDIATIGITDFAQKELKDIVAVDLPEPGRKVKKGEEVAVVDSIKATASIYAPLTGEIVEVNERLLEEPELINKDPYGDGWILKIKIEDQNEATVLLTPNSYIEDVKRRKEGK